MSGIEMRYEDKEEKEEENKMNVSYKDENH